MGGKKITFLSIPVLAVVFLMIYVYYTTVFVFLSHWLGLSSYLGSTNAITFSFFSFMCVFAFGASVLTDPGRVPPSFAPEMENPQANTGISHYCDKCRAYKPPRTHHCRVCKRIITVLGLVAAWVMQIISPLLIVSFMEQRKI